MARLQELLELYQRQTKTKFRSTFGLTSAPGLDDPRWALVDPTLGASSALKHPSMVPF